jgi:molecular chaperone GrpE
MSKTNGEANISLDDNIKEEQRADATERVERELPPADVADDIAENTDPAGGPQSAAVEMPQPAEIDKLRAEKNNLFERLARLQAEFDNYRKRAARENADFRDYAVADAAKALLPVIDNFSLALKNAAAKPEDFRKGVELIHKQLQDVLQKLNVQRIPAQGEPFDPNVHEAIEMVESNDAPDNHVLEELASGYRIKGRLLRPAMVRVARKIG